MDKKNWWSTNMLLLSGVVFPMLALFNQSTPYWIKLAAIGFTTIAGVGWLIAQLWDRVAATIKGFKRRKLPDAYRLRIQRLLSERQNMFSWSYTFSPYCVWHAVARERDSGIQVNDWYTNAVNGWLEDIQEQIASATVLQPAQVVSLAKAIGATESSIRYVSMEIQRAINNLGSDQNKTATLKREWNGAREHFNQWNREWGNLFSEIDQLFALGVGGPATPIPPLE